MKKLISGILTAVAVLGVGYLSYSIYNDYSLAQVSDYASCAELRGSVILETYPEQCQTRDGRTFTRVLFDETNTPQAETETEEGSIVEQTDTSNMQTYSNEEYGFELDYPEDLEYTGPNEEQKLLFALHSASPGATYEFWIQKLDGKTLEQVFEEKLGLQDISYFDWIRSKGGSVSEESIGGKTWIFINGSKIPFTKSNYLLELPVHNAYLIVDFMHSEDSDLPPVRNILKTVKFIN